MSSLKEEIDAEYKADLKEVKRLLFFSSLLHAKRIFGSICPYSDFELYSAIEELIESIWAFSVKYRKYFFKIIGFSGLINLYIKSNPSFIKKYIEQDILLTKLKEDSNYIAFKDILTNHGSFFSMGGPVWSLSSLYSSAEKLFISLLTYPLGQRMRLLNEIGLDEVLDYYFRVNPTARKAMYSLEIEWKRGGI